MDLFHEYKNKYFDLVNFLLNLSRKGLTKEEIIKIVKDEEFDEKLITKDFKTFEGMILNEYNNEDNLNILKIKDNKYYPAIYSNTPLKNRFCKIEKSWIKDLINNEYAKQLLGEETVEKLKVSLENSSEVITDNVDITNKSLSTSNKEIDRNKFFTILSAILENKLIKYTSVDKNNVVYENKLAYPIRIEYSLKDDKFRLSTYCLSEERPVLLLLTNIKSIEIIDNNYNIKREDMLNKLKEKKYVKEPIVLEVRDENSAMERFFMSFSSYETYSKVIGENKYEINLYYYSFQEDEIIRKIISLGPYIVVKSPGKVVDKIICIIKRALDI